MKKNQWLLFITAALAMYGVGNIWLVQLSSYKLWAYVGPGEFYDYHLAWWHSVWGVIFVPAGVVFLGTVLMVRWCPLGVRAWWVWLSLGLQVLLYFLTAIWWGPLMARLATREGGMSMPDYQILMNTHWLRVALATSYGLLLFLMLTKSLLYRGPQGAEAS